MRILELVSYFGSEPEHVKELYRNNELAKKLLVPVLLKLYCELEAAEPGYQFYPKYKYKHYASKIFEIVWKLPTYKESYLSIVNSDLVKKFVDTVMSDSARCMDEGLGKLSKVIEYQTKGASGQELSSEERKDYETAKATVRNSFLEVKEGLALIADISAWAPDSFFFGDCRKRLAHMLNYFLVQLTKPEHLAFRVTFIKGDDNLNFKPGGLIMNIIEICINLLHNKEFSVEVSTAVHSSYLKDIIHGEKKTKLEQMLNKDIVEQLESFLDKIKPAGNS